MHTPFKLSYLISSATFGVAVLAAAQSATAQGAGASRAIPAALVGQWRVVAVGVSDAGVQALAENDPSYMGSVIEMNNTSLSWKQAASPIATEDKCEAPTFEKLPSTSISDDGPVLKNLRFRVAVIYSVKCASGKWGPDSKIYVSTRGAVGLSWYDGGLLKMAHP